MLPIVRTMSVLLLLTGGAWASSDAVTSSSTPGTFHVSGGQIIAPNGTVWYGSGIDIHAGNLGSLTGTGGNSIAAKMPGTNLVRVEFNPLDNNPANYDAAVTALTGAGIVVQFSDYTNTKGGAGGAQGTIYVGSQLSNQLAWFSNMAGHFKNNPYVWFGSNNEPTATYPDGQVHATGPNSFGAWIRAQYDAVRNAGNNNIFVLDPYGSRPIGYGGTPLMSATDPAYFATMTNVIWDPHVYGYQNSYSTTTTDKLTADMIASAQTIRSADGLVPVIIGEFGPGNNLQTQDPNGTQLVASVLKNKGSGWAAWVMDTDGVAGGDSSGNNALLSRGNLTAYGQQVAKAILAGGGTGTLPQQPRICTPAQQ